ncbi:MAG: hypothetical protein APR63_06450 [Desulfuromonas sp. SDB]|nr:MAG: hypothetical protein APR63_06450 [Desulfuromonas sp. SDB]
MNVKFKKIVPISTLLVIIWVVIVITVLMIWLAIMLLHNGETAINDMYERNLMALATSYTQSFQQLYAAQQMEEKLLKLNSLSIAHMIDHLDNISDPLLARIALENNLARIDKIDQNGKVVATSSPHLEVPYYPGLKFLISGRREEIIIWATEMVDTTIGIPFRNYKVAAVRSEDGGAIVVYLDESFVSSVLFYASVSRLVKEAGTTPGMAYLAMQNFEGIVSASGKVEHLTRIENDLFIQDVLTEQIPLTRKTNFKGTEIYEVIAPLIYEGYPWGVLRIGVYVDDYRSLLTGYQRRIFLMFFFSWIALLLAVAIGILGYHYFSLKRQLSSTETITSNLVDSANYGIFVVNRDLAFIRVNQYGRNLFGLGDIKIKHSSYKNVFPQDEIFIERTRESGRELKDSLQILSFPGGRQEEFLIDTVILREQGIPLGIVAFVKEFKQIRKERELESEKKKLKEISQIMSSIAHELRNPLNGISLAVQRINKEFNLENNAELESLVKLLSSEVGKLENKLSNFILFAQPITPGQGRVNLMEIVNDLEKISSCPISIKSDVSEIMIPGQRSFLYRMFENLIDNSLKAKATNVDIEVINKSDQVIVTIADNGEGIPSSYLQDIFKPYFSTSPSGTGLGLYIVNQIVQNYQGSIEVESTPGEGTIFKINLRKTNEQKE